MAKLVHLKKDQKIPREPNTVVLVARHKGKMRDYVLARSGQRVIEAHLAQVDKLVAELSNDHALDTIYIVGRDEALQSSFSRLPSGQAMKRDQRST